MSTDDLILELRDIRTAAEVHGRGGDAAQRIAEGVSGPINAFDDMIDFFAR